MVSREKAPRSMARSTRCQPQRRCTTKGKTARARLPLVWTRRPVIMTIRTTPMQKAVPDGVPGLHQRDPRRVSAAGPALRGAFQARMAAWRMDGKPRTARRFTVDKNCPLPTPEDRLLFILAYLKTYALQVVQGRLFGMVQGKANQWIHVLLPALLAALRALGDAPAR